jgi:hypothetical protein
MSADSNFEINNVRVSKYVERRSEFTSTVSKEVVAQSSRSRLVWSRVGEGAKERFKGDGEEVEGDEGRREGWLWDGRWKTEWKGGPKTPKG